MFTAKTSRTKSGFESCGVQHPRPCLRIGPRRPRPLLVGELRYRRHLVSRHLLQLHRPRHVRPAATRHLHLLLPLDLRLLGPLLRQRHLRLPAHQVLPALLVQRQMAIPRSLAEMITQFLLLILLQGRQPSVCNELWQIHRLPVHLHRLRHRLRVHPLAGASKCQLLRNRAPQLLLEPDLRVPTRGHRPLDRRHRDPLDLRPRQRRQAVVPSHHLLRRRPRPRQSLPLKRPLSQWLERDVLEGWRVKHQSLLTGSARRPAIGDLAAEAELRRMRRRRRRHGVPQGQKAPTCFVRFLQLDMLRPVRADGEDLGIHTSPNRHCIRWRRWTR